MPAAAALHPGTAPSPTASPGDPVRRTGRMRSDALANQERLLAGAVAVMLREGRQVPMAAIALEAGVGVGTLYRHYPTREALLDALTERSFLLVLRVAEDAAARSGPAIAALDAFFEGTLAHRDELVMPLHGGPDLTPGRRQLRGQVRATLALILERGRADGTVRADVAPLDVVVFGALLAQPLSGGDAWLGQLRRQKLVFLAGLAPAPPTLEQR